MIELLLEECSRIFALRAANEPDERYRAELLKISRKARQLSCGKNCG